MDAFFLVVSFICMYLNIFLHFPTILSTNFKLSPINVTLSYNVRLQNLFCCVLKKKVTDKN